MPVVGFTADGQLYREGVFRQNLKWVKQSDKILSATLTVFFGRKFPEHVIRIDSDR